MSIIIKNLRFEKPTKPYQIRVDRASPLGNPFYMRSESERDTVCDKYNSWFKDITQHLNTDYPLQRKELHHILEIYKQYNKLELFCWCAPQKCHAETIKNYIITASVKT